MKIAIYIEPWIQQHAGISVFTENLVRAAVNSKHEIVTIGSSSFDPTFEHITVSKWRSNFFNPQRLFQINKIDLEKHAIEVVIDTAHYATLGLFKVAKRVVVVHDITPSLFPEYHKVTSRLAQRLLLKSSLHQSNAIISVSETTKLDLGNHFGFKRKTTRIYPGLKDQLTKANDNGKNIWNKPFFLAVGTIEPRKNHRTLIAAFTKFASQVDGIDLVIVGGKGWKVNLPALINGSAHQHRIHYLGFVSELSLAKLYKQAIASIYISYYEGFGLPIIEAMSQGSPVITSAIGSMQEIAGNAAILVDPNNANLLAETMIQLNNDNALHDQLIALGNERVKAFDWRQFITQFDTLLDQLQE